MRKTDLLHQLLDAWIGSQIVESADGHIPGPGVVSSIECGRGSMLVAREDDSVEVRWNPVLSGEDIELGQHILGLPALTLDAK